MMSGYPHLAFGLGSLSGTANTSTLLGFLALLLASTSGTWFMFTYQNRLSVYNGMEMPL